MKKRAFTLLELVLTLFIASLIILVFSLLLDFTLKSLDNNAYSPSENASYILSYLSREIKSADEIYQDSRVNILPQYEDSLGFVLKQKDTSKKGSYTYQLFSIKDSKLYRLSVNSRESDINKISFANQVIGSEGSFVPDKNLGINSLAEGIIDLDSRASKDGLIEISMTFEDGKSYELKVFKYGGVE